MNIHGHKLKIKGIKDDLREVEIEIYNIIGDLMGKKTPQGIERRDNLLRKKKKLLNLKSQHKREIKEIKKSRLKKKK